MNNNSLWVFDLDNTLYSPNCGMFDYLNNRINFYMLDRLNVDYDDVNYLRKKYYREYGSTFIGLINHFNINPEEFLRYVHGIDVNLFIKKDNEFKDFLTCLPGRKIIITNSPLFYARNVVNTLGLDSIIENIYDIEFMDYLGKPHIYSINKILNNFSNDKKNIFFIDDTIENIISAKYIGLVTLYLDKDKYYSNTGYYSEFLIPELKGLK
jgi:putative hydrolase of the HAD superfamily